MEKIEEMSYEEKIILDCSQPYIKSRVLLFPASLAQCKSKLTSRFILRAQLRFGPVPRQIAFITTINND
jgi:hypothetical protein